MADAAEDNENESMQKSSLTAEGEKMVNIGIVEML